MAGAGKKFSPKIIDLLDELLGGYPQLRKGQMFGCPGYFIGTKAVACVFGNEVNLTLPPDRIEALVGKPGFRRFEPMPGRTMTGWVLLDLDRISALEPGDELIESAIACASAKALKPK